ncbi:MAG: formylmethanofuran dehydrogenase subunit A [Candidatus Thorarchaeota archaeon]
MSDEILLKNCSLFDPVQGIDGETVDIAIRDGRIVESVGSKASIIDLHHRLVMPGGVDLHSHILGSKIGMARTMMPEYHRTNPVPRTDTTRAGVGAIVPSSFVIGYRYAQMGYTTVIEPAVPALKALNVWEELADVPHIDVGLLPMFSNSMITYHYLQNDDLSGLAAYIAWILRKTGGMGVKVVNPGGTYAWAHGMNVRELDTTIPDWDLTPRQIIRGLVKAVESLGLPHPVHLHPNNLGKVGNVETTIAQLEAVRDIKGHNGRKHIIHLTHISFDSLGMMDEEVPEWKYVSSGGLELAEYANKNDHFTVDLGQITFGPAITMTGDGPFQFSLYQMTHNKWSNLSVDVELPGGAGIVPYIYSPRSPANAVQWAIALEYALSIDDVWRCVMTTDSPNAGPFTQYPLVLSWLMSREQRQIWADKIHRFAKERSTLMDIEREWSLYDVAISTRAAPARILGLQSKGHLEVGADADVAVYDIVPAKIDLAKNPDRIVSTFSTSFLTLKRGEVVAKNGVLAGDGPRQVHTIHPQLDPALWNRINHELEDLINRFYVHSYHNYAVPSRYRENMEQRSVIQSERISP